MKTKTFLYVISLILFSSCTSASIPEDAHTVAKTAEIYPDYDGVTIPMNIAPLNFRIDEDGDKYVTHIHRKGEQGIKLAGKTLDIDQSQWRELLAGAQNDTILVDIFVHQDGEWRRHPAMRIAVAEPIDPYISYRQIEPSYIGFEEMRICQRHLESFDETEIFNNCNTAVDKSGQCINCHSYQRYNADGNMQMHVRLNNGGTVISHGGKTRKINLKTDKTISAGVYPAWHPELPLIAYSNNLTTQNFHSANRNKVEVQDGASDLILYDIENNQVRIIANDSTELETFPSWSPDGKTLYYVSAKVPALDKDKMAQYKSRHYQDFKYNIYSKPFDAATMTFGATDTVYMASAKGASATLPRVSPDGRYLMFAMGRYGTFHIWHHEADLFLMDLSDGSVRRMDEINSEDVESYHSWSSNGRWIIFSSRRDDGSFTRLYMAYFDKDGKAHKPFILPQKDPEHNQNLYKSYNIPEFMVKPVAPSRQELIDAVKSSPIQAELYEP